MTKGEHRTVPLIVADPSASGNWRKEKVRNGALRKKICLSAASSFSFSVMSSFLANLTQTRLFGSFSAEGKGTSLAGNEAGEEVCKAKEDGLYHEMFHSVHDTLQSERLKGKDHKNLYNKILKQPFNSLLRQTNTQENNSFRHAINKSLNPNIKK
ncbi:hypothetical protein PBAC_32930 [Pedobacter glucosidilyticus]|nr:hypothetical protein PBAC_32930 [Pedobacter glucosidilyticus]